MPRRSPTSWSSRRYTIAANRPGRPGPIRRLGPGGDEADAACCALSSNAPAHALDRLSLPRAAAARQQCLHDLCLVRPSQVQELAIAAGHFSSAGASPSSNTACRCRATASARVYSAPQLKGIQEVITLLVFATFSATYLGQSLKMEPLGGVCIDRGRGVLHVQGMSRPRRPCSFLASNASAGGTRSTRRVPHQPESMLSSTPRPPPSSNAGHGTGSDSSNTWRATKLPIAAAASVASSAARSPSAPNSTSTAPRTLAAPRAERAQHGAVVATFARGGLQRRQQYQHAGQQAEAHHQLYGLADARHHLAHPHQDSVDIQHRDIQEPAREPAQARWLARAAKWKLEIRL